MPAGRIWLRDRTWTRSVALWESAAMRERGRAFRGVGIGVVLIAAAASCGGGGDSSSGDTAVTTTSISSGATSSTPVTSATRATTVVGGDTRSACSLITTTQMHDATGRTFTVADAASPRVQTCYFDDGDGINWDFVAILHVGGDAAQSFDAEVASYAGTGSGSSAATDLPGIGQRAKTFGGGYTFVLVGQYVIGIGLDVSLDAPAGDRIETAKVVAQIVASNAA